MDEEKKRKGMGEDEAWKKAKKSKTDVTQEELGKSLASLPFHCQGRYDGGKLTWSRGVQVIEVSIRGSNGQLQGYRVRSISQCVGDGCWGWAR